VKTALVCLAALSGIALAALSFAGGAAWAESYNGYTEGQLEMFRVMDGNGRIDRIGVRELVIDDHLLKLSGQMTYRNERGDLSSAAHFGEASRVAYRLNSSGKIVQLWLYNGELP